MLPSEIDVTLGKNLSQKKERKNMKKINASLDNLVQVPENIVISAAADIPDDLDNSFIRILRVADEYKSANMTPIYILDRDRMDLFVAAKETFGKKLH